ncbi:raucaffricine-O-beta-D-glucosidase-like [Sesamum indicum]|uniref:Raucaffricine-O-beta-D-glucosidase-like n=1 Tax=Sesamum indicum TaxID=4182 RepID=A0A6I9SRA5_SESIN|nr:raucaffricine-O-beta-D-glucosidase-like [Sesamum indicum]
MQTNTLISAPTLINTLNSAPTIHENGAGLTRSDFPHGFIFGTGTSAFQVEGAAAKGGKSISVWDDLTLRTPNMIVDGSNGNVACDGYHKYKEDIKLMKNMGFDSYRFSISWPRILPGGRTCARVNKEGIDYYNDVINTVIDNGMKPFVTLFHWDIPNCLQLEYGGMLSDKVVDDFVEFAEICFQEFGDRVKFWTTVNEPWTYAVRGYTPGDHFLKINAADKQGEVGRFPAHRACIRMKRLDSTTQPKRDTWFLVNDPAKDAYTVARNLLLCHAATVQSYRTNFQVVQEGEIGIVLNSSCHYRSQLLLGDESVKRAYDFMLGWFLEPVIYGQFPKTMLDNAKANIVPFSDKETQLLKCSVDFFGLNYYTADFVATESNPPGVGYPADQRCIYSSYDKENNPVGDPTSLSWLYMVPKGLYDHMEYLKKTYGQDLPPMYITENGVADKNDTALTAKQACADTIRTRYHQEHLAYLRKAIYELRVDVRGYFAWSYCDNFEWTDGYTARFGLVYIDYANNLTRYMKNSALWFMKFLKGHKMGRIALHKTQVETDSEREPKKRRGT